jgi:predicted transcriptional regulator
MRQDDAIGAPTVELTRREVDNVIRSVCDGSALPMLAEPPLRQLGIERLKSSRERPKLSRSLLTSLYILSAFAADGGCLSESHLAAELDINASTAHRYLWTLVAVGELEQPLGSRKYKLAATGAR